MYQKFVEAIQRNAMFPKNENCISVNLTYQQALSIHMRSFQLISEGQIHPTITQKEKDAQIEICDDQRYR